MWVTWPTPPVIWRSVSRGAVIEEVEVNASSSSFLAERRDLFSWFVLCLRHDPGFSHARWRSAAVFAGRVSARLAGWVPSRRSDALARNDVQTELPTVVRIPAGTAWKVSPLLVRTGGKCARNVVRAWQVAHTAVVSVSKCSIYTLLFLYNETRKAFFLAPHTEYKQL